MEIIYASVEMKITLHVLNTVFCHESLLDMYERLIYIYNCVSVLTVLWYRKL
jgi:hypothetical protein